MLTYNKLWLGIALVAAGCCLGQVAQAQAHDSAPVYTYLEADYANINGDLDGPALRGSYQFHDRWYVFGGYSALDIRNVPGHANVSEVGFGYRKPLGDRTDLLGELAYQHIDTRWGDAHGYRGSVGVRHGFSPSWEGVAKVNYEDGGDFNGTASLTLGGQYRLTPTWGIVAEGDWIEGGHYAYRVGVRASF